LKAAARDLVPMKITIKYEEGTDKDLHMTLRLTLPQKYVNGPTKDVVKLFIEHYNKKKAPTLDADAFHLKLVGGNHLDREASVRDTFANGDECYVLGGPVPESGGAQDRESARVDPSVAPAAKPAPAVASSSSSSSSSKVLKDEKGRARCKNFGCQQFFEQGGPPQTCVHHKSPPIFHETAKWWSCCPDRKAYDWEEFMRIPGCQTTFCTICPEGQNQKRFLGGADLRAETAPKRLDADAPKDPRHKLEDLRKGLVAIGVDTSLIETVAQQLVSDKGGDFDQVCESLRARFAMILNSVQD